MSSIFDQQREDDTRVDRGSWFYAAFESDCGECGYGMYKGDRVRYVGGVVVCEDCGEDEE